MKLLNRLLQGIDPIQIHGQDNLAIQSMTADSRHVRRDSLFIARQGVQIDGHDFIEGAIQDGACAILCESMPSSIPDGVTVIQVVNSHRAYAMLAANWHGNPSKDLQVVGVTGTNGKTTVATLLHKLYMNSGIKSGLLSTIAVHIHNEQLPATHTTPDAWDIQSHLSAMVKAGCKVAFMEVSSHGLAQERSHGIHFAGACSISCLQMLLPWSTWMTSTVKPCCLTAKRVTSPMHWSDQPATKLKSLRAWSVAL
jgi:UDP-N-acetylmuramoyl-L-alanyl-D-glutamate--2,6-diaminopimelate ligase